MEALKKIYETSSKTKKEYIVLFKDIFSSDLGKDWQNSFISFDNKDKAYNYYREIKDSSFYSDVRLIIPMDLGKIMERIDDKNEN